MTTININGVSPGRPSGDSEIDGQRVEFLFFRPQARVVELIGDFNQWRQGELAMTRDENGFWHAFVHLLPGDFKFRYMADGQGFPDYAAFGLELGPFGLNSVIHVDSTQPQKRRYARRWAH